MALLLQSTSEATAMLLECKVHMNGNGAKMQILSQWPGGRPEILHFLGVHKLCRCLWSPGLTSSSKHLEHPPPSSVDSYSTLRVQLIHHFLKEALLDTPRLG